MNIFTENRPDGRSRSFSFPYGRGSEGNSGHPRPDDGGTDIATVLIHCRFYDADSKKPDWADRDRFRLSASQVSMLL